MVFLALLDYSDCLLTVLGRGNGWIEAKHGPLCECDTEKDVEKLLGK